MTPLKSYIYVLNNFLVINLKRLLILMSLAATSINIGAHELNAGSELEPILVEHFHYCDEREVNAESLGELWNVKLIHFRDQTQREINHWIDYVDEWSSAYGPDVKRRSPPTNRRNCHSKTFDSKDSWIDDPAELMRNCTSIEPPAQPGPGAVVIYLIGNQITHSGRVIPPPPDAPPGDTRTWVHSQWGKMGDFDHPVDQVPQGNQFNYPPPPHALSRPVSEGPYGEAHFYDCP